MCGIIAVLSRPSTRPAPEPSWLTERVGTAVGLVPAPEAGELITRMGDAAAILEEIDSALPGVPGVQTLIEHPTAVDAVRAGLGTLDDAVAALERWADSGACHLSGPELEAFNEGVVRLKDASWAIGRDRLRTAEAVVDLVGPRRGTAAIAAMHAVQVALSGIDRLEVRGRDSAGVQPQVLVLADDQ